MFKLILVLMWMDPEGQVHQTPMEYQLGFSSFEACQDEMRSTLDQVEEIVDGFVDGNRFLGASYGCVFDPTALPERDA